MTKMLLVPLTMCLGLVFSSSVGSAQDAGVVETVPCADDVDLCRFVRGDTNFDRSVDAADIVQFANYFVNEGVEEPSCFAAYDVNDDSIRSWADLIYLSNALFLRGRPISRPHVDGGFDPTPCKAPPGIEKFIVMQAGTVPARPGTVVNVPVYLTYRARTPDLPLIKSYTVGFRFDSSYLELTDINVVGTKLEPFLGTSEDGAVTVGKTFGRSEGRIVVQVRQTADEDIGLPPVEGTLIANINFRVLERRSGPNHTQVKIVDDAFASPGPDRSLASEVVFDLDGVSVRPTLVPGRVLIEGGEFVRGDLSGDDAVDIQDAIRLVDMLFNGGRDGRPVWPALPGAADINDDGMLSLMDPFCAMRHLFLNGRPPAPPFPAPGRAPLRSMPSPTPGYSYEVRDTEFSPGKHVVSVDMTNAGPAWGFTVSLAFDPAVVELGSVELADDLPPLAINLQDLIVRDIDRENGRVVVTAIFQEPVAPRHGHPILNLEIKTKTFPRTYSYFCFRDGPRPDFQINEIITELDTCRSVRPILRSGRFANNYPFKRGDANRDHTVDLSDGVTILNWMFAGTADLTCEDAADADDTGTIEMADALFIFKFLFLGGRVPPSPGFLECGFDPTVDALPFCDRRPSPDCPLSDFVGG